MLSKKIFYGTFENSEQIFSGARQVFEDYYLHFKKTPPTFDGKQAGQLTKLIKKIIFKLEYHKIEITYDSILDLLITILITLEQEKRNKSISWIWDNLEISLLASKFDAIFTHGYSKTISFYEQSVNSPSGTNDAVNNFFGN